MGDFGTPGRLGFEVLELGFEDLRLGFGNLVLGFEDGGLGFEVLREERGVLSREAGRLGGVKAPGARFACLGGCSRTWWGNTCRWGYGIPLAHCMLLSCPHGLPIPPLRHPLEDLHVKFSRLELHTPLLPPLSGDIGRDGF